MFDFDICAPHVTIPECFTDENSVMVVFDLGRLQFRNLSPKLMSNTLAEQKQSVDDEGEMLTLFLYSADFLEHTPHVGPGHPSSPLSIYFLIFPPFYFSLSFIAFTYFLHLSIPSLSTRIVPLRFQAGGRRR